jgi:hypothetical protein
MERNHDFSPTAIEMMKGRLIRFIDISGDIDPRIPKAIQEVIALVSDPWITPEKVAQAANLAQCFGRGQQYVSLQKKAETFTI